MKKTKLLTLHTPNYISGLVKDLVTIMVE